MPLPDLARLKAAPETILDWMEGNILTAGTLQNVAAPNGLAWVKFADRAAANPVTSVNGSGNAVGIYQMTSNGAGTADSVRAYVCNYTRRDVESVVLGNLGDFCFTTNLNSCTFGIGPAAADGTLRVNHANTGGDMGPQRTQTYSAHGVEENDASIRMLEPSLYRNNLPGSAQATVFGIRSGMNWAFYFQSYSWDLGSRTFTLNGVFPIL